MSIIDHHLDGTPWYLTPAEVAINIAIGRARRRAQAAPPPETPAIDPDSPRKQCRHCKEWLPFDNFNKHSTTADGYDGRCKDCKRIYDRKRAQIRREAAGRG